MTAPRGPLVAGLTVVAALVAACSSAGTDSGTPATGAGPTCPTEPVEVVVSVDQWSGIVTELAGQCARVTTVLANSAVDPHDYEPSPADAVAFDGAQLVVVNGGHYDQWATALAESSAPQAPIVAAVATGSDGHGGADDHNHGGADDHDHGGADDHDHGGEPSADDASQRSAVNPHAWYSPAAVTALSEAVTTQLRTLAPDAAGYFDERRVGYDATMAPYFAAVERLRGTASGRSYAATETVFDDMAAAIGLANRTPAGYQQASSNEAEPSPSDQEAFLRLLNDGGVDVLIYNSQTQGAVPDQLRTTAQAAGVPVVDVTETTPPGVAGFTDWQVGQLNALAEALGVTA